MKCDFHFLSGVRSERPLALVSFITAFHYPRPTSIITWIWILKRNTQTCIYKTREIHSSENTFRQLLLSMQNLFIWGTSKQTSSNLGEGKCELALCKQRASFWLICSLGIFSCAINKLAPSDPRPWSQEKLTLTNVTLLPIQRPDYFNANSLSHSSTWHVMSKKWCQRYTLGLQLYMS